MLPLPKKLLPATITGLKQKKIKDLSQHAKLEKKLAMIDEMTMNYYKM